MPEPKVQAQLRRDPEIQDAPIGTALVLADPEVTGWKCRFQGEAKRVGERYARRRASLHAPAGMVSFAAA